MTEKGGGTSSSAENKRSGGGGMTVRARRRREEAVRRLVSDVQNTTSSDTAQDHDWLVASTVGIALEKGLDRDLHACFIAESKDNAGRIGQVCHDHADVFLLSVASVAALSTPCADLAEGLQEAETELQNNTAQPMWNVVDTWEQAVQAVERAQTVSTMVDACQGVAVQLERARKQAALGRPRAALDAVDRARTALSTPMENTIRSNTNNHHRNNNNNKTETTTTPGGEDSIMIQQHTTLEQTPFGKRATAFLPRIETEVLSSAKRGLNRWLKNAPEKQKAGRSALRVVAQSVCCGPGSLGLGGLLPASFLWRAQTADNWIARSSSSTQKVARAARLAYYFDRDAVKDADKLEQYAHKQQQQQGVERYSEAIAVAFGWYRCWEDGSSLLVDPAEYRQEGAGGSTNLDSSSHRGSRHGTGSALSGSRHGRKGRSLGFRATTSSRSQAYQDITSTLGNTNAASRQNQSSLWTELLVPPILLSNAPTRKEDDEVLRSLPESVHPVRRAEVAFSLLEKTEEFITYYEQNRFGETKIGGDGKDAGKSALTSLTGEDVSVGTDRIFFGKSLPNLCSAVVGFSAEESALELSNFGDDEGGDNGGSGLKPSRFRESSERYERQLVSELGTLVRTRADRANLGELVRMSRLLVAYRTALKIVHPSSTARRFDKDLLNLEPDTLKTVVKIVQDEQLKATFAIVSDDQRVPMLVSEANLLSGKSSAPKTSPGVPDPEDIGLPFGLSQMKQTPQQADVNFQDKSRTSYNQASLDEVFTFSHSVPVILRSLHARAITSAAFALCQQELGQKFPEKKGSNSAGFVLDCVEECVGAAVIAMKDSDHVISEGSVEKAVQVMANISALQHTLPRFYGTLLRGLFHVGLVRADEIDESFITAEKSLKAADKACDAQVGSTYSLVYEICRNKIDSHINISLENFQWVAKSVRETPNPYCEGLIGYLKTVFASLGPMDEGSRAGLHFSCLGHVSERMVKILSGKAGETILDDTTLPPITRIDAFGLKNLYLDCEEFERFADSTGIPSLRDCFSELRILTSIMLDKELPSLLLPEMAAARRRKYPILSLDKVGNILEKYVGTGMFKGAAGRNADMLFIEKKEVTQLLKIVRSQG